ncbi:MAG: plasmid recombination protein [Tannerellaceae bacterium]|nr:plasmid recombination protein [Tannerellaceae bacterium]
MGYTVLHIEKGTGNDAAMSAHIERKITPKNVKPELTHLNKQLMGYPEGVSNRSEAIQYRLKNAGLTRKISKNQVTVLRIMLSATPENIQQIEEAEGLEGWCNDSLQWVKDTFGEANLVAAHLHMDESSPHIHATVIPIVTGERRKAKKEATNGKRKYKKKKKRTVPACVLMTGWQGINLENFKLLMRRPCSDMDLSGERKDQKQSI